MNLLGDILDYINHIQETAFFNKLFSSYPIASILSAITEALETQNGTVIYTLCLFIRDTLLLAPEPFKSGFAAQFYHSRAIPLFENILFSQDFNNRYNALYALAKIESTSSIGALHRAFQQFSDSDPFMLPRLIFELRWLGETNTAPLLQSIVLHPHYLIRWSVLSIVDLASCASAEDCPDLSYVRDLSKDTHQWVRAEAMYHQYRLEETTRILSLQLSERKAQHKSLKVTLKKIHPKLTFFGLEIQFQNHLAQQDKRTFTLEYLDQFAQSLQ